MHRGCVELRAYSFVAEVTNLPALIGLQYKKKERAVMKTCLPGEKTGLQTWTRPVRDSLAFSACVCGKSLVSPS